MLSFKGLMILFKSLNRPKLKVISFQAFLDPGRRVSRILRLMLEESAKFSSFLFVNLFYKKI